MKIQKLSEDLWEEVSPMALFEELHSPWYYSNGRHVCVVSIEYD